MEQRGGPELAGQGQHPQEPAYCRNCRVRKPLPNEIKLHVGSPKLQEYGLKKYGTQKEAVAV